MPETGWLTKEQSRRIYEEVHRAFADLPSEIPPLFGGPCLLFWTPRSSVAHRLEDCPQRWPGVHRWWPLKCWLIRCLDGAADWLRRLP